MSMFIELRVSMGTESDTSERFFGIKMGCVRVLFWVLFHLVDG